MKKKQISVVLESGEYFDDLDFLKAISSFVDGYEGINIVGTHIKTLKPMEKRHNG